MMDEKTTPELPLFLRPYQARVVSAALLGNTLAVLPTGSGKTLVAIYVIRERLRVLRQREGEKRSIIAFLAPTKVLVGQQKRYILSHSDAKVLEITGETSSIEGHGKRHWNCVGWKDLLMKYEVLVMTPQVLKHLLQKQLFSTSYIDTLVIDECHHAYRHDPLTTICRVIRETASKTLILAMTASPVQCKRGSVLEQINNLEANLGCRMLCTKEIVEEYRRSAPAASLSVFRFASSSANVFERIIVGADATQVVGALSGPFGRYGDKRRKNTDRVVFPAHISVCSKPACLLMYAYLRCRHALLVKTIYVAMATMLTDPKDLPELRSIVLPSSLDYRNVVRGGTLPDTSDFPLPTPHILQANHTIFPMLLDTVPALGQVLTIVEECGVLSGIYALILVIEDQITDKFALNESNGKRKGKKGAEEVNNRTGYRGEIRNRSSCNVPYYDKDSHSYIDADKLGYMAKELACSPFNLIDLFHDQYVTCITLLDFFFALAATLGPKICQRASVQFATACTNKKGSGPQSFDISHKELGLAASDPPVSLNRMNAILYMLLRCVAEERTTMRMTSEGCFVLIQQIIQSNPIFDQFKIRLDVCSEAIRRACWIVIRSLSVLDLRRWTKVDEDLRYCSFEPLRIPTQPDSSSSISWSYDYNKEENNDLEDDDFPTLDYISSKVKAVCHVWMQINSEEDFAVHWLRNQNQVVEAMVSKGEDGSAALMDVQSTPMEEAKKDSAEDKIPEIKEPDADASYIVFCKKRLTARSIHFVLGIILENDFGDADLDDLFESDSDVEDVQESDQEDAVAMDMMLSDVVTSIDGCFEDLPLSTSSEPVIAPIEEEVVSALNDIINMIENNAYGPGLAERLKVARERKGQLIKVPTFRPVHLIGGMKQTMQMATLGKFKTGYYNIVFATDVMEEGLDVKACKYVINFDLPLNVKSFIQRKGRSRADNSMMISLIPFGVDGAKMLEELQDLLRQEKIIEEYTGKPTSSSHATDIDELFFDNEENVENGFLPEVSTDSDESMEGLVETAMENLDDFDCLPSTPASEQAPSKQMIVRRGGLHGDSYVVPTTGAEVDARSAVHVLINFCQQLPHDLVFSYKPIFWMEKMPVFRGGFAHYRCSILLPPCVQPAIRFIVGPVCSAKAHAKRLASLYAVTLLHAHGELDDWLFAHGSAQAAKKEKLLAKAAEAKNSAATQPKKSNAKKLKAKLRSAAEIGMTNNPDAVGDGEDNAPRAPQKLNIDGAVLDDEDIVDLNLMRILVKTIPDVMTRKAEVEHRNGRRFQLLHFYCSSGEFGNTRCRMITLDCTGCIPYYEGINKCAVAFACRLPDEIIAEPFRCQIRENETIFIAVSYVCSRWVCDEELYHMQRFHRGVMCWETDDLLGRGTGEDDDFSDNMWIPHDMRLEIPASKSIPIEHDEWRASSGGVWYVMYPSPLVPGIDEMTFLLEGAGVDCVEKARCHAAFIESSAWPNYLAGAADEAQVLAHNLRLQEILNRNNPTTYVTIPRQTVSMEDLIGLIVVRGPGGLSYVHRDNVDPAFYEDVTKIKRVADILKYVPDPLKEEVNAVLVSLVDTISGDVAVAEEEPSDPKSRKRKLDPAIIAAEGAPAKKRKGSECEIVLHADAAGESDAVKAKLLQFNMALMRPMTFAENFLAKYPESAPLIERWMGDPTHQLTKIVPISSVLTLANLIGKFILHLKRPPEVVAQFGEFLQSNNQSRVVKLQKPHKHSYPIFLPQELLRPVGRHKWMMAGLAAPTIVWRMQSYLLALETRKAVVEITEASRSKPMAQPKPLLQEMDVEESPISAPLLVEALTPRLGREILDLERLEMLGDSLLKFVTSVEVFRVYPKKHEGFLTSKRAQFISNHFLIEAAQKHGLQKFIRAYPLCNGRHHLTVRPAGMTFDALVQGRSIWSANVIAGAVAARKIAEAEDSGTAADEPTDFQHLSIRKEARAFSNAADYYASLFPIENFQAVAVNPKVVADVMEALIGAYYSHGGLNMAITVIKALGAWPQVSDQPESNVPEKVLIGRKDIVQRFVETYGHAVDDVTFPANYPLALRRIALGRIKITENMLDQEQNLIPTASLAAPEEEEEKVKAPKAVITGGFGADRSPSATMVNIASILGYTFQNWSILEEALTHCSTQSKTNNQRLEFLGDAVLDLAVVTLLFSHQPWATQGDLSYQKSEATSNRNLGTVATRLQLYRFLRHSSSAMDLEFENVHAAMQKITNGTITPEGTSATSDGNATANSKDVAPKTSTKPAPAGKQTKFEGIEMQFSVPVTATSGSDNAGVTGSKRKKRKKIVSVKRTIKISASALKALADMFEAIMGAIFLDSGGGLESVQQVVKHINLLPQLKIQIDCDKLLCAPDDEILK